MTPADAGPDPAPEVVWEAREIPFAGGSRIVARPTVDGVPVLGADALLAVGPRGVRSLREVPFRPARFPHPLPARPTDPTDADPTDAAGPIDAADPSDAADPDRAGAMDPRAGGLGEPALLAVDGELVPVWLVDQVLADPPVNLRTFVDARTGEVLGVDQRSRSALGNVYPENPVVTAIEQVELPALLSTEGLVGERVVVRSCDDAELSLDLLQPALCHSTSSHAVADVDGNFLFGPDPEGPLDPLAEVQIYWQTESTLGWMAEALGVVVPTPITAHANFAWGNAFYGDFDGDGVPDVSFGQAGGVDLGYDGDVVVHELGHAAMSVLTPDLPFVVADAYGLEWAPGAVNEGAADVFAMLRTGDPLIGEYAGGAWGGEAIRDLSVQRRCPDHVVGEVHHDGEILASFGWSLIDRPEVGPEVVGQLLVGAAPLWGPGTSWDTVGRSLRLTADDLLEAGAIDDGAYAAVLDALDASGMEGCARSVPLDDGRVVELSLFNTGLSGDLARMPGAVELTLDVPDDADEVVVDISGFQGADGLGWAVHGRSGDPVEHAFTELAGAGLGWSVPSVFDWVREGDAETERIVLDAEAEGLRGRRLYLSVASVNQGDLAPFVPVYGLIGLSAHATASPEPAPVGGCGCGGGPAGAASVAGLGWVAAVVLSRRRAVSRTTAR